MATVSGLAFSNGNINTVIGNTGTNGFQVGDTLSGEVTGNLGQAFNILGNQATLTTTLDSSSFIVNGAGVLGGFDEVTITVEDGPSVDTLRYEFTGGDLTVGGDTYSTLTATSSDFNVLSALPNLLSELQGVFSFNSLALFGNTSIIAGSTTSEVSIIEDGPLTTVPLGESGAYLAAAMAGAYLYAKARDNSWLPGNALA